MAAIPQPSASVILLDPDLGRDEPFGVFLLVRGQASKFMPGRYVFPGGKLEPHDGPDNDDSRRICALRELFEEAGVLLAEGPKPEPEKAQTARERLQNGGTGLSEALGGLGLELRPDALFPYARWITPEFRPKRFDTTFYLALMPKGQKAKSDLLETSGGAWLGPEKALLDHQSGLVSLAPPQVRMMGELAGFKSLDQVFAASEKADMTPVLPVLRANHASKVIYLPWDPDYADDKAQLNDPKALPCHAGRTSRLVMTDGQWLPRCKEA